MDVEGDMETNKILMREKHKQLYVTIQARYTDLHQVLLTMLLIELYKHNQLVF